jgi:ABC-type Mn2+/Zn2+ transport system ATPase subunit
MLGLNGCGKSTMMKVIAERQIPIPKQIDIYHLDRCGCLLLVFYCLKTAMTNSDSIGNVKRLKLMQLMLL